MTEVTEVASTGEAEQVDEESISMPKYIGETEVQAESVEEEEAEVQNQAEQKQRVKKVKYRVKFISIAVCIAIALFSGLAIHNAVKITRLSSEVAAAQQQVEVNTTKYIYKISKLDDLIEKGKKHQLIVFKLGQIGILKVFQKRLKTSQRFPKLRIGLIGLLTKSGNFLGEHEKTKIQI